MTYYRYSILVGFPPAELMHGLVTAESEKAGRARVMEIAIEHHFDQRQGLTITLWKAI